MCVCVYGAGRCAFLCGFFFRLGILCGDGCDGARSAMTSLMLGVVVSSEMVFLGWLGEGGGRSWTGQLGLDTAGRGLRRWVMTVGWNRGETGSRTLCVPLDVLFWSLRRGVGWMDRSRVLGVATYVSLDYVWTRGLLRGDGDRLCISTVGQW